MLSLIIPCFNEEEGIDECHQQLTAAILPLGLDYELVFVDDGSADSTYMHLLRLAAADPHTVVCALSRNFGHQLAVSAGLTVVQGDAAVIIDADLQDPPEVIGEMVKLWLQGYDVVYGVRRQRLGESKFKLWTAKLFYRVINRAADVHIPLDTGDFRLIDRKVIDTMNRMPERHRLLRAMCSWTGFKQVGLPYSRAARFAGSTKYPLRKMIALALDGIISFSTLPLRMLTFLGFSAAGLSFLGIVYSLSVRLFTHHWVQGWATLVIAMYFLGGLQLISLGIMGEYLGRIYNEAKQRPLFVVREIVRGSEK